MCKGEHPGVCHSNITGYGKQKKGLNHVISIGRTLFSGKVKVPTVMCISIYMTQVYDWLDWLKAYYKKQKK